MLTAVRCNTAPTNAHTFVGANRAHNCKPCGTHEHTMVNKTNKKSSPQAQKSEWVKNQEEWEGAP